MPIPGPEVGRAFGAQYRLGLAGRRGRRRAPVAREVLRDGPALSLWKLGQHGAGSHQRYERQRRPAGLSSDAVAALSREVDRRCVEAGEAIAGGATAHRTVSVELVAADAQHAVHARSPVPHELHSQHAASVDVVGGHNYEPARPETHPQPPVSDVWSRWQPGRRLWPTWRGHGAGAKRQAAPA
jgi:Ni/Co efflux regulator RcnB